MGNANRSSLQEEEGVATTELGLLEFLHYRTGCMFLSDLHWTQDMESVQRVLRNVEPNRYEVGEWEEAIDYLSGIRKSFSSSAEAKQFILLL
jgi:hypothetical protein